MDREDEITATVHHSIADIDAFLTGAMTIDRLSTHLKVQLAELAAAGADAAWVEELRSLRNQIEYINAFWLESGAAELGATDEADAQSAAEELRAALSVR